MKKHDYLIARSLNMPMVLGMGVPTLAGNR